MIVERIVLAPAAVPKVKSALADQTVFANAAALTKPPNSKPGATLLKYYL